MPLFSPRLSMNAHSISRIHASEFLLDRVFEREKEVTCSNVRRRLGTLDNDLCDFAETDKNMIH